MLAERQKGSKTGNNLTCPNPTIPFDEFVNDKDLPLLAPSSAVLTWDAPTTNDDIDNSCITDHGGYNVYYGEDSANLANLIRNADATCTDTGLDAGTGCGNIFQCTYTVSSLTNGTWYFAVTSYDLAGNESEHSNVDWKVIQ